MMSAPREEVPRDWSATWEQVATACSNQPAFERVYAGPAWENKGPPDVRVWKIAILERRPEGGANHWGHLFVAIGEGALKVGINPEGGLPGGGGRPAVEALPPISGKPLAISIWPRSAETAEPLRAFSIEFQRRAAALVFP
jgi:hypothetical protein